MGTETSDERREGDDRPYKHTRGVPLTFLPAADEPFRWLPRHGEPLCVGEWLTQAAVKAVAWWPIYIVLLLGLSLVVQLLILRKLK